MQKLRTTVCALGLLLVLSSCATPEGPGKAVPGASTRTAIAAAAKPAALPPLPAEADKPQGPSFREVFRKTFGLKPNEPMK